ncbi:calcium-binding protein [Cognatishimia sp. SS12]|uniref:calcium-binding protein n=1 Tax=Cognatishimia sp. SS12 TaxID=2979465 RepID=UPI00232FE9A4|nr:calcium-binding protein [Cognatishimia sp. SS12]MDC0736814.1 calcium-binding protein [Cognatishimia sp. SS12]
MNRFVAQLAGGISAVFVVAILSATVLSAQSSEPPRKIYTYGNSLINHGSGNDNTTVPHWLAYFADQSEVRFLLDGEGVFLKDMDLSKRPTSDWGFKNVDSAWTRQYRMFEQVGYESLLMNPTNFVQYLPPDAAYEGDNPEGRSPLSITTALMQSYGAGKHLYVYEGWADMAPFLWSFPPGARRLEKYHRFNQGEYHDWYVDFVAMLRRDLPGENVTLIPVARILARAFLETKLGQIPVTDLYSDDAPHGTATLYFMAAAITYAGLFEELPKLGARPQDVHPEAIANFEALTALIAEEMPLKTAAATEAAPETPVQAAEAAPLDDLPALGMGLNGISDWSPQVPFVNHMKSARQWVGHLPGQFGGWGHADFAAGGHLDAHGWPIRLPEELDRIETLMLTDLTEEAALQSGVYRLTYEGSGKLDIAGRVRALRYGEGEIWFRFQPGDGAVAVVISETDPEGTGDYIRNIAVVREDQIPLYEAGVIFNPEWVQHIQDMRLLRFMDWMFTNGSPKVTWQDRAAPEDYSYTWRGAPAEIMLALVNQVGADPWFNMPHQADNTYVENFATLVRDQLRPGLKAHVEYSNEVWNFQFEQAQYAAAQAVALWGEAGRDNWMQYAGHRAAEIAEIWNAVFDDAAEHRLTHVLGVHTHWPGLEEQSLFAPLSVASGRPAPVTFFDAYAVTGYFGLEDESAAYADKILGWVKEGRESGQGFDVATRNLAADIRRHALNTLINEAWPYNAKVAARNGLALIMYEGGSHVVGRGAQVDNEALTEFLTHFNYTDEAAALYEELLGAWRAVGGTVFTAFVDVARPSKWGSWGALRHVSDSTKRFDVLRDYNRDVPLPSAGRRAEDFAHGSLQRAEDQGAELVGTPLSDILLGQGGDDLLISAGGDDHIHGGAGVDHALLPGFLEEYQFFREGARLRAVGPAGTVRLFAVETLAFDKAPEVILSVSDFF